MAKAVPVAPDHACKATEQSDDEDDDQDCAKRHVIFFLLNRAMRGRLIARPLHWVALDQHRIRGYGPQGSRVDAERASSLVCIEMFHAAGGSQMVFRPRERQYFRRKECPIQAKETGS
jgi:hypothetical protein